MLALLVSNGGDVDCVAERSVRRGKHFCNMRPLAIAAHEGNVAKVTLLLQSKANPDLVCGKGTYEGRTALSIAQERGFTEVVGVLEAASGVGEGVGGSDPL